MKRERIALMSLCIMCCLGWTVYGAALEKVSLMDSICTHLESQGYSIEKDGELYLARHPEKWTLPLREYNNGILFSGGWASNEFSETHKAAYFEVLNSLNAEATVTRFFVDKTGKCTFEAWINNYENTTFAIFLKHIESDTAIDTESFQELLKFVK